MDNSRFLSKAVGIYLIFVSCAMFTNMQQFMTYISSLINNSSLMFVTGFFTLILGILMVLSHNIWQLNWRIILTIISWIVLLKGATIVICPEFIDQVTLLFLQNINFAYLTAGFDLIIGILLCYFGFKHQ